MRKITNLLLMVLSLSILAGCGSGSGDNLDAETNIIDEKTSEATYSYSIRTVSPSDNRSTVTIDEYGLQQPSIIYSSSVPEYLRLTTAISGSEISGWETSSVMTIYISAPTVVQPGEEYSFDPTIGTPFPGTFGFFNGASSTRNLAVSGTLIFTSWGISAGSLIEGHYDILMEDENLERQVTPLYRIAGSFSYLLGTQSTMEPFPEPVPAAAYTLYQERCQGCHWLSEKDAIFAKEGPTLAAKSYEAHLLFSAAQIHHDMQMTPDELFAVKILLNAL